MDSSSCRVDLEPLVALREVMMKTSKEVQVGKAQVSDYNHGVRTNFLQSQVHYRHLFPPFVEADARGGHAQAPLSTHELLFSEVYQNVFVHHQAVETYLGHGIARSVLMAFSLGKIGMPNPSDDDRIMIALAYAAPWFPRDQSFLVRPLPLPTRLSLPRSTTPPFPHTLPDFLHQAALSAKPLLTSNPTIPTLCTFPDAEWDAVSQQ